MWCTALTEGELDIADRAAEHVMNLPDLLENVVKGNFITTTRA